jgi:hypothetical protein
VRPCQNSASQYLIAEGPRLPKEDISGPGQSANWMFSNNYCDDGAARPLMIKGVKNVFIIDNNFAGTDDKAIALAAGSTGVTVSGKSLTRECTNSSPSTTTP